MREEACAERDPLRGGCVLIGVAGGSGAGKTTLVRELMRRLESTVIDLDSYYIDRGDMPLESRGRLNYDEPAAIDDGLLVEQLDRLARGEVVAKPVYSFASHTRIGETPLAPAPIIIVEGLFTWWWESVRKRLSLKVFIDAAPDLRFARRLCRDVVERGRTAGEVIQQYAATVRPMHEMYVEPCRATADLLVENASSPEEMAGRVFTALRGLAEHRRARA